MNNFKWAFYAAAFSFLISVALGISFNVAPLIVILRGIVFAVLFFGIGFGIKFIVNTFLPELMIDDNVVDRSESLAAALPPHEVVSLENAGEYAVPELYKSPGAPDEIGNIEDLLTGYFKPRSESRPESRSEGIDRKPEAGYNREESVPNIPAAPSIPPEDLSVFENRKEVEERPAENPAFEPTFAPSLGDESDDSDEFGGLPDLDAMAMAFGGGGASLGDHPSGGSSYGGESFDSDSSIDDDSSFDDDSSMGGASVAEFDDGIFGSVHEQDEEEEEVDRSQYKGNKPQQLNGDFNPKELAEGIRTVLSKEK